MIFKSFLYSRLPFKVLFILCLSSIYAPLSLNQAHSGICASKEAAIPPAENSVPEISPIEVEPREWSQEVIDRPTPIKVKPRKWSQEVVDQFLLLKAKEGNAEEALFWVNQGAALDEALNEAAWLGYAETVAAILTGLGNLPSNRAQNCLNNGLSNAVRRSHEGNIECAKMLIKAGADITRFSHKDVVKAALKEISNEEYVEYLKQLSIVVDRDCKFFCV